MLANLLVQGDGNQLRCCRCLKQRTPGFYWDDDGYYVCTSCTLPPKRQRMLNNKYGLSLRNVVRGDGSRLPLIRHGKAS